MSGLKNLVREVLLRLLCVGALFAVVLVLVGRPLAIGAALIVALGWIVRDIRASLRCCVNAGKMSPARAWRIKCRLSFLAVATVALAVFCRQGAALPVVVVFFAIYVAAVTLWVRGQHQASVDAVQQDAEPLALWTVPAATSWFAVLAGLGLLAVGLTLHASTAFLVGILLAYFGGGYALMGYRISEPNDERLRTRLWGDVLLVSVLCVLVALVGLPSSRWWALLLVVPLVLVPSALSVLADPAIKRLRTHGAPMAIGVGAGVYLLAFGAALVVEPHVAIFIAFVVLGLLVVAIVSSTQADIATIVGVVLLMGVTSMSEEKPKFFEPVAGTADLVILGDSYISGEGAEVYFKEAQADDEPLNKCHRAPTSWAALAAQRQFQSAVFLACSGARTFNVTHDELVGGEKESNAQYNEPDTQLDQLAAFKHGTEKLDPTLVMLSLGGNDVGFATIGMMCLAPGDCIALQKDWRNSLPELQKALEATYAEISTEFPHSPIVVAPYPKPVFTDAKGNPVTCEPVALSSEDMRFINDFLPELNATVERAAVGKGFYFLAEMESALSDAHLQLCDPANNNRPGINFIGLRSVGGVAEQRFNPANWYHNSLHPNERGHAAMVQVFERWWRSQHDRDGKLMLSERAPIKTLKPPPFGAPTCVLSTNTNKALERCTHMGQTWALEQLRKTLLPWLLLVVLAAAGAWWFGAGLFGWKTPGWQEP